MKISGIEYARKIFNCTRKKNRRIKNTINIIAGEALNESAIAVEATLIAYLIINDYKINWVYCGGCIDLCEFSAGSEKSIFGKKIYNSVCRKCIKNVSLLEKITKDVAEITLVNLRDLPEDIHHEASLYFDESHSLVATKRALMVTSIDTLNKRHALINEKMNRALYEYSSLIDCFFKKNNPSLTIFKHGIYLLHGPVLDWQKKNNKKFICIDTAYTDSSIYCGINDRYDVYLSKLNYKEFKKDIVVDYSIVEEYSNTVIDERLNGRVNSSIEFDVKKADMEWNKNKPSIAIFTNTLWDADVWYDSLIFSSHTEFIRNLIEYANKYPEVNFIFAPHPVEGSNDFSDKETIGELISILTKNAIPENIYITGKLESSYEISENVDACFVYGSSIGLELSILGRNVYVFASPTYINKGVVRVIDTIDKLNDLFSNISNRIFDSILPSQIIKAKEFIYYQNVVASIVLPNLPGNIKKANQIFNEPTAKTIELIKDSDFKRVFKNANL
jgi:hypothetical protein